MENNEGGDDQQSGPRKNSSAPIAAENNNPARGASAPNNNQAESHKREPRPLIIWTAILAIGTVALGCAAVWSDFLIRDQLIEMRKASIDTKNAVEATNRLADAARDQANAAIDTEHRQLRAYVGPVFNSFRLTTKYAECEPGDTAIAPHTIFCHHFKNYGLTPARVPHNCIVIYVDPVRGTLNETKNAVLTGCAPNPAPTAPTIWPGEERIAVEESQFQEQIALIMAGSPGFLFGKMTYYDVFGDFHFTDICRQIIRGPDQMIFRPCRIEGQQDN
jgi:hypothetical protein